MIRLILNKAKQYILINMDVTKKYILVYCRLLGTRKNIF